jgi:hypothetical protein
MRMIRTMLVGCGLMIPALAGAQTPTTPAQPATVVSAESMTLARELTTLLDMAGNASAAGRGDRQAAGEENQGELMEMLQAEQQGSPRKQN